MFAYYSFIFTLFLCYNLAFSQEISTPQKIFSSTNYDQDLLPASFHKRNREKIRELLPSKSVAVFFASPSKKRSNDIDYEYHQDPNFYYLTGIREPNAVLIIFKEPQLIDTESVTEIIYLEESNPRQQIWTGPTVGTQKALEHYQIQMAKPNHLFSSNTINWASFENIFIDKLHPAEYDPVNKNKTYHLQKYLTEALEEKKIKFSLNKLTDYMASLRQIKSPEEIDLLRKSCEITCSGFRELMRALQPGMKEYQTEAIMEYYFKSNGAEFEGYPSICGAAENSVILHYSTNRRILNDGDLIVVDAGAEYHGYSADITRTLPVNGKFSTEQKIIYNIVLEAQAEGIAKCKPGANFWDPHAAATAVIKKRLLELGIIKDEFDYIKYFMHGTSHYLGLDVHDCGLYQKLEPGMVITVEPGIYIREGSDCDPKWWNIGVRIEDDVLITPNGNEILSKAAPKTVEEIESLMKEESLFHKLPK